MSESVNAYVTTDARGSQLLVQAGVGVPSLVETPTGFLVSFDADGQEVHGSVRPSRNPELMAVLLAAQDEQRPVSFRVETRRLSSVDPKTVFARLDPLQQCVRLVAAVDGESAVELLDNPADLPAEPVPASSGEDVGLAVLQEDVAAGKAQHGVADDAVESLFADRAGLVDVASVWERLLMVRDSGDEDLLRLCVAAAVVSSHVPVPDLLDLVHAEFDMLPVDALAAGELVDVPASALVEPVPEPVPLSVPVGDPTGLGLDYADPQEVLEVLDDDAAIESVSASESSDPDEQAHAEVMLGDRVRVTPTIQRLLRLIELSGLDPQDVALYLVGQFGVDRFSDIPDAPLAAYLETIKSGKRLGLTMFVDDVLLGRPLDLGEYSAVVSEVHAGW